MKLSLIRVVACYQVAEGQTQVFCFNFNVGSFTIFTVYGSLIYVNGHGLFRDLGKGHLPFAYVVCFMFC